MNAQQLTCPLAIYSPSIGAPSETFVRRHMEDLLPHRTAIVTENWVPKASSCWSVSGPTIALGSLPPLRGMPRYAEAVARRIRAALGVEAGGPRDRAVARFMREHGVQCMMGEYLDQSLPWLPVARATGVRFFAHAHGYDVSERLRDSGWRDRYLRLAEADGIITVSNVTRERLMSLGLPSSLISVIPCGVDVPVEPPSRAVEDSLVRCIAVGRMTAKKAPLMTLAAFAMAHKSTPNLRLDFVGAGELMTAVDSYVTVLGLHDCVTLHGSLPNADVQAMMRKSDVFLQHSVTDPDTGDEEGLPVAVLEAMANALPVVATRHAGIPEAVGDGETGYLVDELDFTAMADRIAHLGANPELRSAMGRSGWAVAGERFSWRREQRDLLKVLGLEAFESSNQDGLR